MMFVKSKETSIKFQIKPKAIKFDFLDLNIESYLEFIF